MRAIPPKLRTFKVPDSLIHRLRGNPEPSVYDYGVIAKDMVKEGKLKEAQTILTDEAKLTQGAIATVFYAAVADVLRDGKRAEAKKLFTKVRRLYRGHQIPLSLRSFVPFTLANVRIDIAEATSWDEDDLDEIEEFSDWGVRRVFRVRPSRDEEYVVVRTDGDALTMAIERVKQDLQDQPEIFNQEWLESHINQEKLREIVRDIVLEDEYVNELAESDPEDVWAMAERAGLDVPETDEDGDMPAQVPQKVIDQVKESMANDQSANPMEYLRDMMGEEATAWAMERAGIDIEAAAREAVRTDGAGHFLSSYDGNTFETVSGFTYWRE